jgi:hypothetical protein
MNTSRILFGTVLLAVVTAMASASVSRPAVAHAQACCTPGAACCTGGSCCR